MGENKDKKRTLTQQQKEKLFALDTTQSYLDIDISSSIPPRIANLLDSIVTQFPPEKNR